MFTVYEVQGRDRDGVNRNFRGGFAAKMDGVRLDWTHVLVFPRDPGEPDSRCNFTSRAIALSLLQINCLMRSPNTTTKGALASPSHWEIARQNPKSKTQNGAIAQWA
ncbi:MAG: hypothetical protein VKJ64_09245 [Leptolyngbyaceae bacterium]|nr:hypothetical protein [Leptolyngbyaceae bacterium]